MLRTPLCDLLGIEHPIINAPMAGPAQAELAAAVSQAGGLGLIGGSSGDADWLRGQIRAARKRTARPFGVGFISSSPGVDALVRVALEERVAVVAHSFADPSPYVAAAHAAGAKVLAQVQSLEQAQRAARAGVDALAAQGLEAGGHTGTRSSTLTLLPAVLDAVGDLPVVAAGGVADGRGLAAVLLMGAAGAWMGTRFAASAESAGSAWGKARIVAAGPDDTVLTKVYDTVSAAPFPEGIADRVLANEFTDAWQGREAELARERAAWRERLAAAAAAEDARLAPVRAGSGAGLVHGIEPASEIVRRTVAEAERLLRERPGQVLG